MDLEKKRQKRRDYETKMAEKFPNLYCDMHGDPRQTCMAWGFDIGPGWYPIVEDLSKKLEKEIVRLKKIQQNNPENIKCNFCGFSRKWHRVSIIWQWISFCLLTVYKTTKKLVLKVVGKSSFKWVRPPCKEFKFCLPRACQVKEKFGTLRFYISTTNDYIEKCIDDAENKSAKTCEECGAPGKLRKGGWIKCLCDKCHKKDKKR